MIKGPEFLYKIVLIGPSGDVEIDWGNHPGWKDEYKQELDEADILWLIPKEKPSNLRNVSVKLGDGRRWILFSRVFGSSNRGFDKQVRFYAVGWQETDPSGVNKKSLVWIYPSGEMEIADEPSYAKVFLGGV